MYAQKLRRVAAPLSVGLIIVGFFLVISGYQPLGIVGAAMLVLAIFVPFLSLGNKPDPAWLRTKAGAPNHDPRSNADASEPDADRVTEAPNQEKGAGRVASSPRAVSSPRH